jgi:hypothetical protein
MHRAWHRVELGVVNASGLAEPAGRGRELVPDPIEIDALAPRHEPLHIRTAKAEVPEQRIFQDFFPWPNAGQRRIDENKSRGPLGILRGKSVADHRE